MRNALVVLVIALVAEPSIAFADDPAPMEPYKAVVGDNVFVMLPGGVMGPAGWRASQTLPTEAGGIYELSGLYRNDGSTIPLWTVDWYARETYLSNDGQFLVRVDSWPGDERQLAVAFYDRGKLLRQYAAADLVTRPADLPRSVSHLRWLATASLDSDAKAFRVTTLERQEHLFDVVSGGRVLLDRIGATTLRTASVGEPFALRRGERIAVPEADLLIELEQLSYRRCPVDICLVADGPVVTFRVVVMSTGVEVHRGISKTGAPDRFPYFVLPMSSDGETYARFSVQQTVKWCELRSSRAQERDCWSQVAALTDDAVHCSRILAIGLSADACYEQLAEQRAEPVLCDNVKSELGWCGYVRATSAQGDPLKCGLLTDYRRRGACVTAAAARYGRPICAQFARETDRDLCLRVFGETLHEPHVADRER